MTFVDARTGIELIDREECLRLLRGEEVGRLAVVVGGHPHIFPVNYVMDGDAIVFRTEVGTKFDGATRSAVAFEIDRIDPARRVGWSVVAHGPAEEVTRLDRLAIRERLESLGLESWVGAPSRLLRIVALGLTGRRLRGRE